MSKSIRRWTALAAGFLMVVAISPGLATAQAACSDHTSLVRSLSNDFAEHPISMGLAANGTIFEIFASEKGAWTILVTRPDGISCLVATGEGWENLPKMAQRPEA